VVTELVAEHVIAEPVPSLAAWPVVTGLVAEHVIAEPVPSLAAGQW
jgi:hypothetical protein